MQPDVDYAEWADMVSACPILVLMILLRVYIPPFAVIGSTDLG
jgi:hypothetical protein